MPFRPPETFDVAERLLRERVGERRGDRVALQPDARAGSSRFGAAPFGGLKIGGWAAVVNPPRRQAPSERPRHGRVGPSPRRPVRVDG